MNKEKIALVDYFNTVPFLEALKAKQYNECDIIPANPAICSSLFFDNKVDIALVPIASWIKHGCSQRIITDFCIGCEGKVATVLLNTNDPLKDIDTIYLDSHSRTSAMLLKVLCKEYWKIHPTFVHSDVADIKLTKGVAKLMIGDKVFYDEQEYVLSFDLGQVWEEWTSLPFAFAVWVAHDHVSLASILMINESFKKAFGNMQTIIEKSDQQYSGVDLKTYFSENISYHLDKLKKRAIKKFQNKITDLAK